MKSAHPEPHWWSLRARATASRETVVYTGKTSVRVGRGVALEPTPADHPASALELFVASLAGDLVDGFRTAAARRRLVLEDVEMSLRWSLENPLVHFAVHGEVGSPRLERIRGTLFVSGPELAPPGVEACWQETLIRSPLYQTLHRTVEVALRVQIT